MLRAWAIGIGLAAAIGILVGLSQRTSETGSSAASTVVKRIQPFDPMNRFLESAQSGGIVFDLPPQLDAGPIRERLLALIGNTPPNDVEHEIFDVPTWCVEAVSTSAQVDAETARSILDDALLISASRAGEVVLAAIEQGEARDSDEQRDRLVCARELFYALPGDEPAPQL